MATRSGTTQSSNGMRGRALDRPCGPRQLEIAPSTVSPRRRKGKRDWTPQFLVELENRGSIAAAASAAGISRHTVYDERGRNPDFNRAVGEAAAICVEQVEAALFQRAVSGEDIRATICYLRAHKPEVYGDRFTADRIAQIKQETRDQLRAELQDEMRTLPREARQILIATIPPPETPGPEARTKRKLDGNTH